MPMKVVSAAECRSDALRDATIAVIGYGNQGQAHARNLRDSGYRVMVGQRRGGASFDLAVAHGFEARAAREAASEADLVILAVPDEGMAAIYREEIAGALKAGAALGFIHGFNIRFGLIVPPAGVDVILVAPKGPGRQLREAFEGGGGLAAMIAVQQDSSGRARERAIAWAAGIGAERASIIETTFADEAEADLFGEQAVLCGGVIELMKAGYETLVAAGCPAELAYFECIHEVKLIVDLVHEAGFEGMRRRISGTARYGGLTRGPRIVSEAVRAEMRRILDEVRSGRFAKEWTDEVAAGAARLRQLAKQEAEHPAERAGATVREWSSGDGP